MKRFYYGELIFLLVIVLSSLGKSLFSVGVAALFSAAALLVSFQRNNEVGDIRAVGIVRIAAFLTVVWSLLALVNPDMQPIQPVLPVRTYLMGIIVIQAITVFVFERIIRKSGASS